MFDKIVVYKFPTVYRQWKEEFFMKSRLIFGAALLISGMALAGCGTATASSTAGSSAATLEKDLTIYGGCEEPYLKAVAAAFGKKYNINCTYLRLSSGEIQSKIEAEDGNPSADVLFGGTTDPYNALKTENLLVQYASANASHITDAHFKDADNYWYGIYKGILGFMWNKDQIAAANVSAPATWDDLIKTDYKKMITWSAPTTAGTAKLVVNTMVQKKAAGKKTTYVDAAGATQSCYDDTAAMEYFKSLDANTAEYTKSGSGASKAVGKGECKIGIGFLHDVITQIVDNKYTTIGMAAPSDGTAFEVGATAILKGCKHPELAKKFIDFALTPECVELGAANGSYQFLVLDNAKQPQAAIDAGLSTVKVMDYDFDDAKKNIGHYVEDFQKVVTLPTF
jgi:iron(III) transport system substrate-binding protein